MIYFCKIPVLILFLRSSKRLGISLTFTFSLLQVFFQKFLRCLRTSLLMSLLMVISQVCKIRNLSVCVSGKTRLSGISFLCVFVNEMSHIEIFYRQRLFYLFSFHFGSPSMKSLSPIFIFTNGI